MKQNDVRLEFEALGYTELWSDAELEYGGVWAKEDKWGNFTIIELIDLEGAAGVDGTMLVERKDTFYGLLNGKNHRSVQGCCDTWMHLPEVARRDKALARLMYANDICTYGLCDTEWRTVILDPKAAWSEDNKGNPDNWGWLIEDSTGWDAVIEAINQLD